MEKKDVKKAGKPTCCSCETEFKKEVNEMVKEVEGYSKKDHDKKREELKEAFDKKK